MQGGYVIGLRGFHGNFVMIHHRGLAGYNFRNRVGEIGACARVTLDDGALRVGPYHYEGTRMARYRLRSGSGQVDQMNGLLDYRATRDADERAIIQECGIERHESVVR